MEVEMKQYKKCGSCRALSRNHNGSPYCYLGYSVMPSTVVFGIIVDATPCEPCPKPLTVKNLVLYSQTIKKR
jgi:hypothetical protein